MATRGAPGSRETSTCRSRTARTPRRIRRGRCRGYVPQRARFLVGVALEDLADAIQPNERERAIARRVVGLRFASPVRRPPPPSSSRFRQAWLAGWKGPRQAHRAHAPQSQTCGQSTNGCAEGGSRGRTTVVMMLASDRRLDRRQYASSRLGGRLDASPDRGTRASRPAMSPPNAPSSSTSQRTRRDEGVALLERAVNINSGTQNLAGVRAVGKLFAAELEALGFTTRWVDGAAFKRAGHLVAEHPGARAAHPADRPPRHRVRAGQPVPEIRAARARRRRGARRAST